MKIKTFLEYFIIMIIFYFIFLNVLIVDKTFKFLSVITNSPEVGATFVSARITT